MYLYPLRTLSFIIYIRDTKYAPTYPNGVCPELVESERVQLESERQKNETEFHHLKRRHMRNTKHQTPKAQRKTEMHCTRSGSHYTSAKNKPTNDNDTQPPQQQQQQNNEATTITAGEQQTKARIEGEGCTFTCDLCNETHMERRDNRLSGVCTERTLSIRRWICQTVYEPTGKRSSVVKDSTVRVGA